MFKDVVRKDVPLTPEQELEKQLAAYRAKVSVVEVVENTISRQFLVRLGPGVRINKLQSLSNEIGLILGSVHAVRVFPVPEKGLVAIEIPLVKRSVKGFKESLGECEQFHADTECKIPLLFGVDATGDNYVVDLTELPHLLVSGQTGSGKSVFLRALINSVMAGTSIHNAQMLLIDPKNVEFSPYNGSSNLLVDTISEPESANEALWWLIERMEKRYTILAQYRCSNIFEFNQQSAKKLPPMVVFIDEFADLVMQDKEISSMIVRLAQKGRAAGIYLIIATQRPSSKVIDGLIKANFAARVALRVVSVVDSRIVLDQPGAEKLLGKGDMLFSFGSELVRLQGIYTDVKDIECSSRVEVAA